MRGTRTRTRNRERYEQLRRMLQDRRSDIQQKLRSLREAFPTEAGDVRDTEEQSLDAFVQEVDLALMQMKSETLKRIDEAMRRLEDGSYGKCVECSGEISAARLRALPFAELCRDCQQAIETADSEARDMVVRAAKSAAHGLA